MAALTSDLIAENKMKTSLVMRIGAGAANDRSFVRSLLSWAGCAAIAFAISVPATADELPHVSAQPPWTLHDSNDDPGSGYTVYKRTPVGSEFSAYRIEAILDAPLDLVARLAAENIADPEFRPKNTVKTILREDDEALLVHSYIKINAPFISDRDVISRVERSFDPETGAHRLTWSATSEGMPPMEGVIRLDRSDGYWSFTEATPTTTRAVYVSHTEIAGSIPSWIVNQIMSTTMVQGIEGLRDSIETASVQPAN